ncbi:hypothetical protein RvY_12973 [Ramazzottius varieornatus]|uniref:Uncharacterized protein n=1 Tax=Ramazzottius varieornatus TaxID=947166 RepID=A0A1D1VLA3_RAMVA|nr:hypothetical protein RvY_12973 [Ramazzottius varieornatus]
MTVQFAVRYALYRGACNSAHSSLQAHVIGRTRSGPPSIVHPSRCTYSCQTAGIPIRLLLPSAVFEVFVVVLILQYPYVSPSSCCFCSFLELDISESVFPEARKFVLIWQTSRKLAVPGYDVIVFSTL